MAKRIRQAQVTLLELGALDETLHYGPYSRYWWRTNKVFDNKDITYFPIRIGQKTKVVLNDREFVITIAVGYSNNPYLPGYNCQSDTFYTETPVHDPSTAISSIYTRIFNTKTRYSGPLIIGWTDRDIVSQLLVDVSFFPFFFNLGQFKIFVFGIGSSSREDWNQGGSGYQSSLIHIYGKKQGLYISSIEDDICKVEVYQDSQLKKSVEGVSPNDVWENFSINKYDGVQLFGLDYVITQRLIKQHRIPTCTPNQWKDFSFIKTLYDYHVKRRTLSNISWHNLFITWLAQESNIIELNSALIPLYPKDYQFSNRELNAWRSMFRAAGAYDITPWLYTESKVHNKNFA